MMLAPEHDVTFEREDGPAHQSHIRYMRKERGLSGFGALECVRKTYLGLISREGPLPLFHERRHLVATPAPQYLGSLDGLRRLVGSQLLSRGRQAVGSQEDGEVDTASHNSS